MRLLRLFLLMTFPVLFLLAACLPGPAPAPPPEAPPAPQGEIPPRQPTLQPAAWEEVPGWLQDEPGPALTAFQRSCQALRHRAGWGGVCAEAELLDPEDGPGVRSFFEDRFRPYRVQNPDGSSSGTITGYYVPDLRGSRTPSKRYRYPIYGVPDDLLVIDLRSLYPELGDYRLRGRLEGRRVVPYWNRGQIDGDNQLLQGKELLWTEDPVELFFLHIQGSGLISLEGGEKVLLNYAEQNGHPYRSIGKLLLERQEMSPDQMSMQNLKLWARKNPERAGQLLFENPSYVFFRELEGLGNPPGALGVPLTAERSLAIDPRAVPLGAPVFLATTWPNSGKPLRRLMVAQDTGGAIKGAVRADFFWGVGNAAGELAGRMKQRGEMWVLLPAGLTPETLAAK